MRREPNPLTCSLALTAQNAISPNPCNFRVLSEPHPTWKESHACKLAGTALARNLSPSSMFSMQKSHEAGWSKAAKTVREFTEVCSLEHGRVCRWCRRPPALLALPQPHFYAAGQIRALWCTLLACWVAACWRYSSMPSTYRRNLVKRLVFYLSNYSYSLKVSLALCL